MLRKFLNKIIEAENSARETNLFREAVDTDEVEDIPRDTIDGDSTPEDVQKSTEPANIVDPLKASTDDKWKKFEDDLSAQKIPETLTSEERSDYITDILDKTLNPDKVVVTEATSAKTKKQIDISDEEYTKLNSDIESLGGSTKAQIQRTDLMVKKFINKLYPTVGTSDEYSEKIMSLIDKIFSRYVKNQKNIKSINDLYRSKNKLLKIYKYKIKFIHEETIKL